jgi:UDP-N-acetylmuramate dehydrogenase
VLVLGGGSNLLVGDAGFAGTVVRVANLGREIDCVDAGSS